MNSNKKSNTTSKKAAKGSFAKLLKMAHIPWVAYILYIVVMIVTTAITARLPYVAGQIMSGEIFDNSLILTYVGVTIVGSIISNGLMYLSSVTALYTDRNLQKSVWHKIVHLPMSIMNQDNPAMLISRVTTDTTAVSSMLAYIVSLITITTSLVTMMQVIYSASTTIFWTLLLLIPWLILCMVPGWFMRKAQDGIQTKLSVYTDYLSERLMGMKLIKTAGEENEEIERGRKIAWEQYKAEMRQAWLSFASNNLTQAMRAVILAIILIFGAKLIESGEIDIGVMITLIMYADFLPWLFMEYPLCYEQIKKAQGMSRRISELMTCEDEALNQGNAFAEADQDIHFENVSFAYGEDSPVLNNINLTIPKGKVTAIVGHSGSGKTTVLNLLSRLYQPTSGRILFGETPAESISLKDWRESFGVVLQSSPLLFGSIRDNITYGVEENASESAVMKAADMANIGDFIRTLPDGLETEVGEVGSRLSGGERQRIALARMMIREPDYLLLDEATSNLDARNSREVSEALGRMMDGRTGIMVTHDVRSAANADHIILMEQGQIVGAGTHETLYADNKLYRRYYDQA